MLESIYRISCLLFRFVWSRGALNREGALKRGRALYIRTLFELEVSLFRCFEMNNKATSTRASFHLDQFFLDKSPCCKASMPAFRQSFVKNDPGRALIRGNTVSYWTVGSLISTRTGDHDGNARQWITLITEDKRNTWICEIDMISGSSCLTCDFNCFNFRLLSGRGHHFEKLPQSLL